MMIKKVNITYFIKNKKITIEDVNIGDIVFVKVKSPLNYGIREVPYYGKIMKKTNCYFEILEYYGGFDLDNWKTEQIKLKENNKEKYTKKWAKKSILEMYSIKTEEKVEIRKFGSSI